MASNVPTCVNKTCICLLTAQEDKSVNREMKEDLDRIKAPSSARIERNCKLIVSIVHNYFKLRPSICFAVQKTFTDSQALTNCCEL